MNLYQVVVGQQLVRTLFKSLAQLLKMFFKKWPPVAILDVQKSLCIAFLTISDHYHNFYFVNFVYKMAAGGHFGCPKITFGRMSGHFRSIRNFFLIFFYKMAAVGHFGCPKITFDLISIHFTSIRNFNYISGHFRSIRNFIYSFKFLTKWPLAILDVRK